MVSRSRISPTRITFGACRSAALSAAANVGVSLCSSRWWTVAFLCWCRNSIGSSMVRMCSARVSLIRSMIAASVDDLPEPVGPGDQDDAVLERGGLGQDGRQLELGERRNPRGDDAHDDGERAALPEDVDAEPAALGQRIREIAGALFLERAQCRFVAAQQLAGDARGVLGAEQGHLRHVHRNQVTLFFDLRRAARREHEIADALAGVQHRSDQLLGGDRRWCRGVVGGSRRARERRRSSCSAG